MNVFPFQTHNKSLWNTTFIMEFKVNSIRIQYGSSHPREFSINTPPQAQTPLKMKFE